MQHRVSLLDLATGVPGFTIAAPKKIPQDNDRPETLGRSDERSGVFVPDGIADSDVETVPYQFVLGFVGIWTTRPRV